MDFVFTYGMSGTAMGEQNNGDAGSGRAKNNCARALIIANLRCCVKGIKMK